MKNITLGDKYEIIEAIISSESFSAYLCKNTFIPSDNNKYIVNFYHSKEYVKSILPHAVNLNNDICPEFVEVFTDDSKLAIVFKYISGSEFNAKQMNVLRKSVYDRLLLAHNYLVATMNISALPDIIKISLISNKALFFTSDNRIFYNYIIDISGISQNIQIDVTMIKICGITLKAIFSGNKNIPDSIMDIVSKTCKNEYKSIAEIFYEYENTYKKTLKQLEEDEKKSLTINSKNNNISIRLNKFSKSNNSDKSNNTKSTNKSILKSLPLKKPILSPSFNKIMAIARNITSIGQEEIIKRAKKTKVNTLLFRFIKFFLTTAISLGIIVSVSYLFYSSLKKAALDAVSSNNTNTHQKNDYKQSSESQNENNKKDTNLTSDESDSVQQDITKQDSAKQDSTIENSSDNQTTASTDSTKADTVTEAIDSNDFEVYVVKSGDTLYSLSLKYYNDGMSDIIKSYNQLKKDELQVGQELKIPKLAPTKAIKETSEYRLHTIKENETLSYISKLYYGSLDYYEKIIEYNQMTEKEVMNLQLGSVIKIPYLDNN